MANTVVGPRSSSGVTVSMDMTKLTEAPGLEQPSTFRHRQLECNVELAVIALIAVEIRLHRCSASGV